MAKSTTRKPGDSIPDAKPARNAEATFAVPATALCPGTVYTGTVKARQADGTYAVTISDPQEDIEGVQLAFPVLGGLMGLQIRSNLPQMTTVKLVYGTPSYIFAVIPENNEDWLNARTRSLLWGPAMDGEQGVTENNFSSHAEDIVEGEVEFSNLYGSAVEFLTNIMRMRAGDRAAVECHLINDMVRVISGQFSHISGIGEELIFDHGRPTRERTWSSYRHELMGVLAEKEPFAEMNGDEVDREKMEEVRVSALGRHRYREFMGFAGDFIHKFVTDPPAALVSLAKGQSGSGAGKSWMHQNSDGSIIMQSVADIRIERVCRIPVPVRFAHHEDPEVTTAREYDKLDQDFLKLPQAISPTDPANAYQMAYHIRSYARWLSRYHSFARMLQLSGEYEMPSEADSPTPDWNNKEEDRSDANARIDYYDAYACISIMRDGSIVTQDGYGSSVSMINGNIQVAAARHLELEAAGDIRMVAGGSVFVKARRNIELSAVVGGLVLHGYAWVKALCEKGTLWLRSNAVTDRDTAPEAKEEGAPVPEIAGWDEGEDDGFGVLIEASAGGAALRSEKGMTIATDGSPQNSIDTSYNLNISTRGGLDLLGRTSTALRSRKLVSISSAADVAIATRALLSNASEFIMGPNVETPFMVMRYGTLWARQMEAGSMAANLIRGPKLSGITEIPDTTPTVPLKQHFNHIGTLDEPIATPNGADADQSGILSIAVTLSNIGDFNPWVSSSDGPVWSFPTRVEYAWDDRETATGAIPETITQQYLRLDALSDGEDRWSGEGYEDWPVATFLTGPRTSTTGGFGTYEAQLRANDEGENLHEPSATAPEDMTPPETTWQPAERTLKSLKRPSA